MPFVWVGGEREEHKRLIVLDCSCLPYCCCLGVHLHLVYSAPGRWSTDGTGELQSTVVGAVPIVTVTATATANYTQDGR